MNLANVWEYARRHKLDTNWAYNYARELFRNENGIEYDSLVNEDAFSFFESNLKKQAYAMAVKPRNKQFPAKLPLNYELLAATYGVGRDEHLAVVLGFNPGAGKFVTWIANFSTGPQKNEEVECGNGHYFDNRDAESQEAANDLDGDEAIRAIRTKTATRAWVDFTLRSVPMVRGTALLEQGTEN